MEITGTMMETAATAQSAPTPDPSSAPSSPEAAGVSPAAETAATAPASGSESPESPTTDPTTPPTPTPTPGPIPFTAHKTALDNARTKAAAEVEARYAWAQGIPEAHRQTTVGLIQLLDRDPTQAVEVLMTQIAAHPEHAPKLRSLLGRILGTRPQASQAPQQAAMPEADAFGVDEQTGRQIPLYSADALVKREAALRAQIQAELAQQLGPLQQDFRARQAREAEQQANADAKTWADQEYSRVSAFPHFAAYEAQIAAQMQADATLSVRDAYIMVVVPSLQAVERKAVVTGLQQKQQAASINPATGASASHGRPSTFEEAFAALPPGTWG